MFVHVMHRFKSLWLHFRLSDQTWNALGPHCARRRYPWHKWSETRLTIMSSLVDRDDFLLSHTSYLKVSWPFMLAQYIFFSTHTNNYSKCHKTSHHHLHVGVLGARSGIRTSFLTMEAAVLQMGSRMIFDWESVSNEDLEFKSCWSPANCGQASRGADVTVRSSRCPGVIRCKYECGILQVCSRVFFIGESVSTLGLDFESCCDFWLCMFFCLGEVSKRVASSIYFTVYHLLNLQQVLSSSPPPPLSDQFPNFRCSVFRPLHSLGVAIPPQWSWMQYVTTRCHESFVQKESQHTALAL